MSVYKNLSLSIALSLSTTMAYSVDIIDISQENLFVPAKVSSTGGHLKFVDKSFIVNIEGIDYPIKTYNLNNLATHLSSDNIQSFLNSGYLSIGRLGEDYTVSAETKLLGGGKWKFGVKIENWFRRDVKPLFQPQSVSVNYHNGQTTVNAQAGHVNVSYNINSGTLNGGIK